MTPKPRPRRTTSDPVRRAVRAAGLPPLSLFPMLRCPECASVDVVVLRTTTHSPTAKTKRHRCRACDHRFVRIHIGVYDRITID